MGGRLFLLPMAAMTMSAAEPAQKRCEPAPVIAPAVAAKLPSNSSYISDAEPPARFLTPLKGYVKVYFGREAINEQCGVPPCGKIFLGCRRGDTIVLPDPSDPHFAKITRHEIAHFNGWPATHGD